MADGRLSGLGKRGGDETTDAASHTDAAALVHAVSAMAQAPFLDSIKSIMDLDKLLVETKQEFPDQLKLCDGLRALMAENRSIRNEAVSIVLTLKDVADNATDVLIPVFTAASDDSDVSSGMETIVEMIDGHKKVHKRLSDLKVLQNAVVRKAAKLVGTSAPSQSTHLIAKLYKQCTCSHLMVGRMQLMLDGLVASADSADKIQHFMEVWSEEGRQRKKSSEMRYRMWLEEELPKEMAELSQSCEEFIGKEPKERENLLIAMNISHTSKPKDPALHARRLVGDAAWRGA